MFEPEKKDVLSTGWSSESKPEGIESERQNETRVTNLDWYTCRNYKNEKREFDYVAKKSMLSMGFFTTNKLSAHKSVNNWKFSV